MWVKAQDGGLINLAHAYEVQLRDSGVVGGVRQGDLTATGAGFLVALWSGTYEECRSVLDSIQMAMRPTGPWLPGQAVTAPSAG